MARICLTPSEKRDADLVHAIVQVWRRSVEASHTFLSLEEIDAIEPEVYEGVSGIDTLLVAYAIDDTAPVAFAGVQDGKLEMLFVDAVERGCGYGSLLIEEAISSYGVEYVDVNEANKAAADFYLEKGFVVEGRSELDSAGRPYPILHMRLS